MFAFKAIIWDFKSFLEKLQVFTKNNMFEVLRFLDFFRSVFRCIFIPKNVRKNHMKTVKKKK